MNDKKQLEFLWKGAGHEVAATIKIGIAQNYHFKTVSNTELTQLVVESFVAGARFEHERQMSKSRE